MPKRWVESDKQLALNVVTKFPTDPVAAFNEFRGKASVIRKDTGFLRHVYNMAKEGRVPLTPAQKTVYETRMWAARKRQEIFGDELLIPHDRVRRILKVTSTDLGKLVKEGKLVFTRINKACLYDADTLVAYMSASGNNPTEPTEENIMSKKNKNKSDKKTAKKAARTRTTKPVTVGTGTLPVGQIELSGRSPDANAEARTGATAGTLVHTPEPVVPAHIKLEATTSTLAMPEGNATSVTLAKYTRAKNLLGCYTAGDLYRLSPKDILTQLATILQ